MHGSTLWIGVSHGRLRTRLWQRPRGEEYEPSVEEMTEILRDGRREGAETFLHRR